jgi:hypothetical protein
VEYDFRLHRGQQVARCVGIPKIGTPATNLAVIASCGFPRNRMNLRAFSKEAVT